MLKVMSRSKSYPSFLFPLTVIKEASPRVTLTEEHSINLLDNPSLIIFSIWSLLSVLSSQVPAWFQADWDLLSEATVERVAVPVCDY
jgi:hypothetical protein